MGIPAFCLEYRTVHFICTAMDLFNLPMSVLVCSPVSPKSCTVHPSCAKLMHDSQSVCLYTDTLYTFHVERAEH